MSDDRVAAFRDAVRSDDTAAAIAQFDDFDAALDDQQARESAVRDVARGLLARRSQNPEGAKAAKQYLEAVAKAQQARIEAKNNFLLYLKDGPSGTEVADSVDAVVSAHDSVRENETTMRQTARDVALPTTVQVIGPGVRTVPLGQSVEIDYEVANVGLRGISDVAVEVEGFGATADPSSIDKLSAGSETTVAVSGTPETSEETTLKVTIDDATAQTRIVPLDKAEYVDRIWTQFEETNSEIDEAASLSRRTVGNGSGKGGKSTEPFAKDGIEVKLQANVENGRLTLREKVKASKKSQLQAKVNVHPAATPEQGAAAHLALAATFLDLAERAPEEGRPDLANRLLREFESSLRSASDALSSDETSKGQRKKRDDEPSSPRQRAIWAQDLGQVADLAVTARRAEE